MEVLRKRGQENGPKAETDKTERPTTLGRRTREEIKKKWDQTDSPGIPDRGETSEIPRPPFGALVVQRRARFEDPTAAEKR